MLPVAGGAGCHFIGNIHKIFSPGYSGF